ncbi:MAG TPA: glycosyltransferase family 2 protein [Hyphomicrobiaceae bacterium]|nr:glycosyltransferase family 2 protein [Hyphomicrobiaceae bacterium]
MPLDDLRAGSDPLPPYGRGGRSIALTVVVPVLNEERNLAALVQRLVPVLEGLTERFEIIFVDDGSSDRTLAVIAEANLREPRLKAISLSRRFGKEIALSAGLRRAVGDAVIMIDADLQHPPEVIRDMVARWREGYDVVYGQRRDRESDSRLRRAFAHGFYGLFRSISGTSMPEGAGDFRLLDRRAVNAFNQLGERARFNKGLYAWIGFKSVGVPFEVAERHAGASRFRFASLTRFALDGLTSFSTVPLRISTYLGLAVSSAAFLYALIFLAKTLFKGIDQPGFPTTIIAIMLLGGIQLISLGVIGEYLGRVYEEVKARPLYIEAETVGALGVISPVADGTGRPHTSSGSGAGQR